MVKSYDQFEQSEAFGVINSGSSNVVWTPDDSGATSSGSGSGLAYVGGNEDVFCWNTKTGELLSRWHDNTSRGEVSVIERSKVDPDVFAVGYTDGYIRVWDSKTQTLLFSFDGHRSEITALAFDESGTRLASGSRDTDIIIWDLISETGAFKLRGHRDQIVSLDFIHPTVNTGEDGEAAAVSDPSDKTTGGFLLASSKDALLKLWDLTTQYCVETHMTQTNGECWSLGLNPDKTGFVTGGNEGEMKVWFVNHAALLKAQERVEELADQRFLIERGVLQRQGRDKTTGIQFHPTMSYFAVHGSSKMVEVWRIRSEDEVVKSLARKVKRKKEKAKETGVEVTIPNEKPTVRDAQITDIFVSHLLVRPSGMVRSCDWVRGKSSKVLQILVSTRNNQLETFSFPGREKKSKSSDDGAGTALEATRMCAVEIPGHRTDVRCIALSSDDRMLATASNGSLKIWNVKTQNCLRTVECGYALSMAFLPGDKIVVIGTKTGELELLDIASSTVIERFQAHEGAVWSLKVHPDGKSMVTGGADKSAKFWNFKVVQDEVPGTKRTVARLKLVQTRVLKLTDDILSLCYSPDGRLLAVATLDSTVKVFFHDSLKLFLNLYGHKLPVLNMSIASDSKLLATCSADKNVRLWGLDFGDCHKALFAHQDSIMQVAFPAHAASKEEAHYFFSASKDRTVKQWDGDKFEKIQELRGHHGEVWAMAVSQTGEFVVTASRDKSIRVWRKTGEPLFLEEEREKELEALYDSNLVDEMEDGAGGAGAEAGPGAEGGVVGSASKQTTATLTAGEKITEALALGIEDLELVRRWPCERETNPAVAAPARNPVFVALNVSAERYVLNTVARVPPSQLHDALLVLSFSAVPALFAFVEIWLARGWNVGLACRVLFFLLKTHHHQLVASAEVRAVLTRVRAVIADTLGARRNLVGFNLAALAFLDEKVRDRTVRTVEDVDGLAEDRSGGRTKRAFVDVS